MKEIKREIEKIIFSETPCKSPEQEKIRKVEELVNLFETYARSLMPKGLSIYKTSDGWAIEYEKYNFIEGSKKTLVKIKCDNETEPNTRAKMLIFLRENGYITFNQGDEDNAQFRQQA